jgi:hypothetical protein
MKYNYMVHTLKFVVSLLLFILFAAVCICLFVLGRPFSATVFAILAFIFIVVSLLSGSVISIDATGICHRTCGITVKSLQWENIAEVGVIGTKVFNKHHPSKTGTIYIYFSETPMTDQERFAMMLKWPPLRKIYMCYTSKRFSSVQTLWDNKIIIYNIGNLTF